MVASSQEDLALEEWKARYLPSNIAARLENLFLVSYIYFGLGTAVAISLLVIDVP
jgi:hypothetical protein